MQIRTPIAIDHSRVFMSHSAMQRICAPILIYLMQQIKHNSFPACVCRSVIAAKSELIISARYYSHEMNRVLTPSFAIRAGFLMPVQKIHMSLDSLIILSATVRAFPPCFNRRVFQMIACKNTY